jgi:hypothetical protein
VQNAGIFDMVFLQNAGKHGGCSKTSVFGTSSWNKRITTNLTNTTNFCFASLALPEFFLFRDVSGRVCVVREVRG